MKPFHYKGIAITLNESGKFEAIVGGKKAVAASLDAMKKRLDKAEVFKPFKALTIGGWRGEVPKITEVVVVGIEVPRKTWRGFQPLWKLEKGSPVAQCYPDTPAVRADLRAYSALIGKRLAIVKEMEDREEKALAALPVMAPKIDEVTK